MIDKEKYILSKESAQNELDKLFDYYEIDIDEIEDRDLKRGIKGGQSRLIKAIRLGRLEINTESGLKVIQYKRSDVQKSDPITYREIDGVAKTEMSGKDDTEQHAKMYAVLGSLSGFGEAAIKKLKGVDLSLAEVLGMIFLSV